MSLPQPISNSDFFLAAIIEKLEEIRIAVIDVESELQKLSSATQSTQQPKVSVTVDASKVAEIVNKRMDQIINEHTPIAAKLTKKPWHIQ